MKEAIGVRPLDILDSDIVRLIGETKGSQEGYKQFVYQGIEEELDDVGAIFEKNKSVFGSSLFYTLAQKKYLRKRRRA